MTEEREVVLPEVKHVVDALKSFTRNDPVELGKIAARIERRNRHVGPFTLDDVDEALKEAERLGLVNRVEVGQWLAFNLTDAGLESD